MGHSGAEVARFLGATTSSVNRLAVSERLPEVRKYLNALQNLRPPLRGGGGGQESAPPRSRGVSARRRKQL